MRPRGPGNEDGYASAIPSYSVTIHNSGKETGHK